MSKASSIKQFVLVHSILANNLPEEFIAEFTNEQAQAIIGNPTRAGVEYMKFLANGARVDAASAQVEPKPEKPTLIFFKRTRLGTTWVTAYDLGKRLTFAQMFRALLKLAPDAPLDEVEELLKERKHPIPAAQAEEMLESQAKFFLKQKGGEDFGLRGDGWANLILVENVDGTVSVVHARWLGSRWYRNRYSLDDDNVWYREYRLVVSNSDTSNL